MPSSIRCIKIPFPHLSKTPLAPYSTFKIGGPAEFLAEAKTAEELALMLQFCSQNKLPYFILGKGSNILFDDRGFQGLVILNKIDYLKQEGNGFRVGAGYSFARLGTLTAREGFTGLEFAAGIPATCGGAIYMNAGASGSETCKTLVEVTYVFEEGVSQVFKIEELKFSYRHSPFQNMRGAIAEAVFSLQVGEESKKKQRELVDYRLKTQPYKEPSAGCVFRNCAQGAAGQLIERCGLKGARVGGAEVSQKHANFIVNTGGASAAEVKQLIGLIKERLYQEMGVHLEEEIRYVPYT